MIGDIIVMHCLICDEETDHQKGIFKSKEIDGEWFHLNAPLSELLKKNRNGFHEYTLDDQNGVMDSSSPSAFAGTMKGGLILEELFSPQIRSLKCSDCQHLIRISRFPL